MGTVEPIRNLHDLKKIEKLLSSNTRDLMLFTLGTNSGLRISDILALDVGDVKNKTYIQLTEKKTKKIKKFPINSKLKSMLKEFTKNRINDEPLFTTKFKNRLSRVTAYYTIRNACQKAKPDEKFGTHTMRKTFGYHHYKKYKDIAMLQKIFNHSNPVITLKYIGIEQEEIYNSYLNFIL